MDSSTKRPLEGPPQTPKKKATELPSPLIDTPLSENSVTQSIVTSQLSTEPRNRHIAKARTQEALNNLVHAELGGACFESSSLASAVCPDRGRTKKILVDLQQRGRLKIDKQQHVTIRDWPSGSNERDFYAPFVDLLNDIIDSFDRHFPNVPSYLRSRKVRFYTYDREMEDSVDFAEPFKPDFVGGYGRMGPFVDKQCSWLNVEIPGEIKRVWPNLVKQATTYARCAFAASEHRYFVPTFVFDQKRSKFRLLIFSRSGLVSTEEVILSQSSGIKSFVSIVVGMLSWKTELEAGYIDHQTHSHMKLNNILYRIEDILCRRRGIRGRVTNVYHLLKEPDPLNPQVSTRVTPIAQGKELEPLLSDPKIPRTNKQLPFSLPDQCILKCTNSLASRTREEDVFKSVQGYIGIVDIVGAYDADRFCVPSDAKSWDILETKSPSNGRDKRLHRHIIMKTCGRRLSTACNPQELAYAILHTMMGHCALFTQGGYLHRDISHGNILLLPEEKRKIPSLLREAEIVTSDSCIAILIDGDVAKKWGETQETSSHRSGTKPFLSVRVTRTWSSEENVTHTPIDDLESFVWVLVFVLLQKTIRTDVEDRWWRKLNADSIDTIGYNKELIAHAFANSSVTSKPISRYLTIFAPLLYDWFALSATFRADLETSLTHDAMETLSMDAYKAFISRGLQHIPSLPTEWPST